MNIESAAHILTDKFRLSPTGFDDLPIMGAINETQTQLIDNPEEAINPLGGPVEDLTLFAFGDTHFHVPDRISFDRTDILPTTIVMNALRGRRSATKWHRTVRPMLYNHSLADWPFHVASILEATNFQIGDHTLIVHTGDVGDDSLNCSELTSAILATQAVTEQLQNTFDMFSGGGTESVCIQGVGDHDADYRAWPQASRTDQVRWFYEQAGLNNRPACFLQEIGSTDNSRRAVLVVDTNLCEEAWVDEARKAAMRGLARMTSRAHSEAMADDIPMLAGDSSSQDLLLYQRILKNKKRQDEIIRRAQTYDETIILGHKPNIVQKIASACEGSATVIAGHWHVAYNSDEAGVLHLPIKKTRSGKTIRTLIVAPPTRGAGGVEVSAKQAAYVLNLSARRMLVKDDILTVCPT